MIAFPPWRDVRRRHRKLPGRKRPSVGVAEARFRWQSTGMSKALQIVATDVLYYHDADERAFFEWLDRMDFVSGYYGVVRDLFIDFSRFPTEDDIWEIIGFCRRYGINMHQLAKFESMENSAWMRDPTKVWCAEIFENRGDSNSS